LARNPKKWTSWQDSEAKSRSRPEIPDKIIMLQNTKVHQIFGKKYKKKVDIGKNFLKQSRDW